MAYLKDILAYANSELDINNYKDYCPNGLQVSGSENINCLVSGVSLNMELIDAAISCNADAILVHHGAFWHKEPQILTGVKRNRITKLLKHNISLLAYHLPLDAHNIYGNNVLMAKAMGWSVKSDFDLFGTPGLGLLGEVADSLDIENLQQQLQRVLGQLPIYAPANTNIPIKKIAWCTGAAEDGIEIAHDHGADVYISGEISERTYHLARELNIHYLAVGHHVSERFGVNAFGSHLGEKFNIEHKFIDIHNPV